jgi:hypothetical protein
MSFKALNPPELFTCSWLFKYPVCYQDHQDQVGSNKNISDRENIIVIGSPLLELPTDKHPDIGYEKTQEKQEIKEVEFFLRFRFIKILGWFLKKQEEVYVGKEYEQVAKIGELEHRSGNLAFLMKAQRFQQQYGQQEEERKGQYEYKMQYKL